MYIYVSNFTLYSSIFMTQWHSKYIQEATNTPVSRVVIYHPLLGSDSEIEFNL